VRRAADHARIGVVALVSGGVTTTLRPSAIRGSVAGALEFVTIHKGE
jgi:hypothetical protein